MTLKAYVIDYPVLLHEALKCQARLKSHTLVKQVANCIFFFASSATDFLYLDFNNEELLSMQCKKIFL